MSKRCGAALFLFDLIATKRCQQSPAFSSLGFSAHSTPVMAPLLDNPNDAILPDFETAEHAAARLSLINSGVADDVQAAAILTTLWTMSNTTAKQQWAEQLEEAARAAEQAKLHALAEQAEAQRLLDEERDAARKEEQVQVHSSELGKSTLHPSHHPLPLRCPEIKSG